MEKKILVAYASKYGATAEIAEKIGQILLQAKLPAEVLPVEKVKETSPYRAVVLGTALYIGQWRKAAAKFLQSNEATLSRQKVWLFMSGPTGEGDPKELVQGWHIPKSLQPVVERVKPQDVAVFHGNVNFKRINFVEKWMIGQVKAASGDFRDWKAIQAWAASIADSLKKAE